MLSIEAGAEAEDGPKICLGLEGGDGPDSGCDPEVPSDPALVADQPVLESPSGAAALPILSVPEVGKVELFLNNCSSPTTPPLIPTPPPHPVAPAAKASAPAGRPIAGGGASQRCSGRLAAKPSNQLSSLDKALFVLMKKEGAAPDLAAAMPEGIERIKNICQKPLPSVFVAAISSLMVASSPTKKVKA